jgi:hypothetical protein
MGFVGKYIVGILKEGGLSKSESKLWCYDIGPEEQGENKSRINGYRGSNGSEGEQRTNDAMYQRTFVADKLPDDCTLVSKHVAVGTLNDVYFVMSFIVFYLVHFVGF